MIMRELGSVLFRWIVSICAIWVGSTSLHAQIEQVPDIGLLGAVAVVLMLRGAAYGVADLIGKSE